MKRLIALIVAWGALPVQAAVTVTASSLSTFPGAVGYSTALLNFNASGAWTDWRLRVNPSASCAAGAGTLQGGPPAGGTTFTTGYGIIAGGLLAGQHYFLCVELSDDGGSTFSPSGALGEVQATTLSVIENEPRPVKKFDSRYPDTGDFASMPVCPAVNAQNYCRVNVPGGTTNINSIFDTALGAQCTHGTVIAMPHSATPIAFTANVSSSVYAACPVIFWDAAKVSGNNIDFGAPHGLTEGQLLTFGNHGFHSAPSSTSCYYGNGFLPGSRWLVHVVSANVISLRCGDGSNNAVVITGAGDYPANQLFFLPHVATSGLCPTVAGDVTCSYQKVASYEVIIRTDTPDNLLPPPGVRITPAYFAAGLGSIWINPVSNVGINSSSAVFVSPGNADGQVGNMVSNVRIGPGIELTNEVDVSQRTYCNMISAQVWGSDNKWDRVYFHGGETRPPTLQRWGGPSCPASLLEGYNTAVRDSYIDNLRQWHASNGIDGSSILTSQGPGPMMWVNNYIEGAGIPIHFDDGGGDTYLRGDFSVLRNTFHSPTFMMHGSADSDGHYSGHRQHLEAKAGWGIEVAGNVFDTNWTENNPNSEFFVITSVSPNGGQGAGVFDVNVFSNTFKHGPGGIGMPLVVYGGNRITPPPARFAFRNNFLNGITGKWVATSISVTGPKGWWYQGPGGGEGAITDHNTMVGNNDSQPGSWLPLISRFQQTPFAGWQFTNNFSYNFGSPGWGYQQEGGVGFGPCFNLTGEALANACLTPSYVWQNNVMMSATNTATQIAAQWPTIITANYNPVSQSLSSTPGWINYDPTGAGGSYGLRSTSNYRSGAAKTLVSGPATDGRDVGIDEPMLLRNQGHVRFASVTPIAATTATVNFVAPDAQACPVRVATTPWTTTAVPTPTSGVIQGTDSGTLPGPRSVALTGLVTSTLYYGIVLCAVEQPTFQFFTRVPVTFADFTSGMTLQHDWEFGTGGGRNVTNITDLAVDFVPYGIAGTTPINQEWERYQVPPYPGTFNTTNFVFTSSTLDLTATIPGGGGLFNGGINSGQIFTTATWNPAISGKTYAFEGRLKIPPNLQGMWPAFWLYPPTPGTSDGSEVDIIEYYKMTGMDASNWTGNIHGPGAGSTIYSIPGFGSPCGTCWTPGTNFSSAFHLYQLVWTPTATYHFVDGVLVIQRNFVYTASGPAGLIVNLAVGSDLPGLPGLQPTSLGEFPMVYSIDHLKQWSTP